ncbi:major facilitator superfamily domain-containing protein [Naematelia encephala]|uniref:Major facilitator superfamily domain-containing protein n=1 Tax=Naematelia encephala TaxID=71784 RepID=A0A1Y2BP45_9TREE|nr:major facilitator superfamily domain-containing protein [Naematelia encephala]
MGSFAHKLRVAVWGEKPETKQERILVMKIDTVILTYSCVSYFFNYLDRAGLANAYVSGMKEDVHLVGTNYNVITTCLTVGYIIGQVPHALAIQKISPRIWFPAMVAVWGGLTMCCAAAKTFQHLCVIRFFQGIVEASTYSGTQYIIGSWYKPSEIGKRTGLFAASGMAGTMFSGIMMTAIHSTMDGKHGIAGWRWLFIILGIITIPVAAFGFVFFPDVPDRCKAFWLTEDEKQFAIARLPPRPPNAQRNRLGWSLLQRVLLRYEFWVLTMLWVIGGALEAFSTQTCMLLWMKATGRYTVSNNNTYPLGITAVGIFLTLATAVLIDASGKHMPWGFVACVLQIVACIILIIRTIPDGAVFAGYFIAGSAYMIQPVCFTWANKILIKTGDDAARAITLYSMNGASSVLFSFWGIILYPATDASKRFRKGTIAMFVISAVLALWIGLTWALDRSITRKAQQAAGEAEVEEHKEWVDPEETKEMDTHPSLMGSTNIPIVPAPPTGAAV